MERVFFPVRDIRVSEATVGETAIYFSNYFSQVVILITSNEYVIIPCVLIKIYIMMKKNLFDEDSDTNENITLNNEYAKKYESWRRKEELNKYKARYGDEGIETSSSSEEDENGNELTEEVEKSFFKTLSCLKNKDPRIYDEKVNFFSESKNSEVVNKGHKKKDKPVFLRDYERDLLLKTGGNIEKVETEENYEKPSSPTYVEEQKQIKENLKALLEDENEAENKWGGMFDKRKKTKEEEEKEEKEYRKWLKGQKDKLDDETVENELKPLKDYWNNPKLDSEEMFLRDYILNKKFLDNEDDSYIPSYEQIIHDSDNGLSDDEKTISNQEIFETKYNFRFEEPDQEFIKRYPRTMSNSVRKTDDRRKQKRVEIKARKEAEKLQKEEELKQLKALKRNEIQEKIEKLKEITGNMDLGFKDEDIDGDFDPNEHDKRMTQLFNEEFYQEEEGDQKPEFPDIDNELEIDNWEKWAKNEENYNANSYEPHCEDDDFNMDCEYDPSIPSTSSANKDGKRKNRRKKSKFVEEMLQKKPTFDPNEKTYEEYLDEYYKLDYEDMIGDSPCRFKYRKVMPNSFGLTIEEILLAKEKELNRWCSLKKAIQIRPEHVEKYDVLAFQKKAANVELKKKVLKSLYESEEDISQSNTDDTNGNKSMKAVTNAVRVDNTPGLSPINRELPKSTELANNKQNKKKKNANKSATNVTKSTVENSSNNTFDNSNELRNGLKRKKDYSNHSKYNKKLKNSNERQNDNVNISDERLKAYGINPKKFKNKIKYSNN